MTRKSAQLSSGGQKIEARGFTKAYGAPVNGLDPEGIVWIRELMRGLAAEGRTVFVSSHLMNEMAVTADHLIVIGQGKLLRDEGVTAFIDDSIEVAGLDSRASGELAAAHGLTLHELATQHASLENAFMDLTHDSVDYRASAAAA